MQRLVSTLHERGTILNVSFYRFTSIRNPGARKDAMKSRASRMGLRGSILLSEEGINGFLAGPEAVVREYLAWMMAEYEEFRDLAPKESFSTKVPFRRMLVKVKNEIITMGRPEIRPSEKTGKNLRPAELKRWYDEKKDFVILDTRNDYEIAQGTFKGAIDYGIETFREFPEKLEAQAKTLKDKTVVMFCTGGIRCEKATALAMDLGIKDVYQLEGGILKYFEEVGHAHYRGDCFVFDHRTNVDARLEPLKERTLKEKAVGLRLHASPDCPFCIRVLMALQAKNLPVEVLDFDLAQPTPERVRELSALNPHGEVPVLQHGDLTIYGSETILAYLDENYPETLSLFPVSAERRARARIWIDWADSIFGPDVKTWLDERENLTPDSRRALEIRLEKHLYRLKTPLQRSREFLVIDALTRADLAAYSMLKLLRNAGFPGDYPERFDLVWNWYDRVEAAARPRMMPSEEPRL